MYMERPVLMEWIVKNNKGYYFWCNCSHGVNFGALIITFILVKIIPM